MIAANLTAAFLLTKHFISSMQERGWGRIINIASVHGLVASVNKVAYVPAKHVLVGLIKVVALVNANRGITVNAICPGWVETELIKKQYHKISKAYAISVDAAKLRLLEEKQPSKQFVRSDQIADLVCFLCSDSANAITGVATPLDGGWTAQ